MRELINKEKSGKVIATLPDQLKNLFKKKGLYYKLYLSLTINFLVPYTCSPLILKMYIQSENPVRSILVLLNIGSAWTSLPVLE